VNTLVATTQIATTVLKALGLDPRELEAMNLEGAPVLPGLEPRRVVGLPEELSDGSSPLVRASTRPTTSPRVVPRADSPG
jgi:hypothetical protein